MTTYYNVPQGLKFTGGGRLSYAGDSLVSSTGIQEHSQEFELDGLKVDANYYNPGGDLPSFVDVEVPTGETYEVNLGFGRSQTREACLSRRIHNAKRVDLEAEVEAAIAAWVDDGKRETVKGFN